jgi:hypothetical protein
MKTLDQKMKSISRARRKKVEARTTGLIAEEMTLQELRQARKLTIRENQATPSGSCR